MSKINTLENIIFSSRDDSRDMRNDNSNDNSNNNSNNKNSLEVKSIKVKSVDNAPSMAQNLSLNSSNFTPSKDNVFERIANRYDVICNLFSFGVHHFWKRHFIKIINKEPWHNLLDVASGTGELVFKLLRQNTKRTPNAIRYPSSSKCLNPAPQIIVSDLSQQMLKSARHKLVDYQQNIQFIPLDAHNMTGIASNSQDVVTISMGLKLLDRRKALAEALRVLKPQGRLITMEVSTLPIGWMHNLYLMFLTLVIPLIAKLMSGNDGSIYRYLLQGIKDFPNPNELVKEIKDIGFGEVKFERLSLGVVAIHTARKA